MASGSTMCDSLTGGKGTYKCLCKKHYCHLAWTAHMLKLLWDSVGFGADWSLEFFFRYAMRHCGMVQLKLVELRLSETLCNDQWMDVGSRPTFFVLIIVSIQVQCRNELDVTLFSHDRRLVFKRSKNLRQMGAMTCCDLGLHLILPQ